MPPMRVLAYTETYVLGGCDRYLADLANALDPAEFELSLAGNPNPAFDEWLAERAPSLVPRTVVPVSSLLTGPLSRGVQAVDDRRAATDGEPEAEAEHGSGNLLRESASAALRAFHHAKNLRRLRALLRAQRPDLVHINNGGYPGGESCRTMALAAAREGIPVVHFVHNMAYEPRFPRPAELRLDRALDRATGRWLTAAERASDALSDTRAIPRDHVDTVHYGVPLPARVEPAALDSGDRAVAAVVASFEERKGHLVLFDALAALPAAERPLTLLIGEGPRKDLLARRCGELGLDDDVRFLGWRSDVPSLLAASDLLVLPSTSHECLPYAILEAMALGLPVVSTDVAGIPEEVEDGVTGRVVAPGEPEPLTAAIRDVLGRDDRGKALGAAGRARIESEFSIERMVARTTAVWKSVSAQPGR